MDDLNRSISQYVKTGQYYEDAKKWYANKYIFISSQRTYIVIILSFYLVALSILGLFYMETNPAPPVVNYMALTEDIAKAYAIIVPAGDANDSPQVQVTKYMVAKYVKMREAYKYSNRDSQLNFIKNSSEEGEYLKYYQATSINNPASPVMLYQEGNVRTVNVENVKLLQYNSDSSYKKAEVRYKASLRNLLTNKVITQDFIAIITFKIDDINVLLDKKMEQLNFLVSEYYVNEQKVS